MQMQYGTDLILAAQLYRMMGSVCNSINLHLIIKDGAPRLPHGTRDRKMNKINYADVNKNVSLNKNNLHAYILQFLQYFSEYT